MPLKLLTMHMLTAYTKYTFLERPKRPKGATAVAMFGLEADRLETRP